MAETDADEMHFMHPNDVESSFDSVLNFVLGLTAGKEQKALQEMAQLRLVDQTTLPIWVQQYHQLGKRGREDLVSKTKLSLDALASQAGKLSRRNPLMIVDNALDLMPKAQLVEVNGRWGFDLERIQSQVALDFGSGLYGCLSAAIVLFINGFKQVISYEPFSLNLDYVESATFELVKEIYKNPADYVYSQSSTEQLKQRLARLDLSGLHDKLLQLNQKTVTEIDFNGIILTNKSSAIQLASVDFIFSNSVLEHVSDLSAEIQWQKSLLKERGVICHTVDFIDHRYYRLDKVHPFQKYFDGQLLEINGLMPSQMEAIFQEVGFEVSKTNKMALPEHYLTSVQASMQPEYQPYPLKELAEWVNGYCLTLPSANTP